MKTMISNLFGWGGKRKDEDSRRSAPRVVAEGPVRVYWRIDGVGFSGGGQLRDANEDGSGVGFVLRKQIPVGTIAWIIGEGGSIVGGVVRHADQQPDGYRTGVQLDTQPMVTGGWGGVQLSWVGRDEKTQLASATLRNSGEGCLEINCTGEAPVGSLLLIAGPEVSCLCWVTKCQPYGKRYLLEAETTADAVSPRKAQAA